MRRTTTVIALVALLATACGGGEDSAGDGGGTASSGVARVWAPASAGLDEFLELEIATRAEAAGATLEVVVEEGDRADVAEAAANAAATGDYDAVLVPGGIGRQLVADGVLVEPISVLWEMPVADDGLPPLLDLSILMGTPAPSGTALATPVHWVDGCTDHTDATTAVAHVAAAGTGNGELHDWATDAASGVAQSAARETANEVAWRAAAKALAQKYGAKAAARIAARGNPITGVAMTAIDLFNYFVAVYEATDARAEAMKSSAETVGKALEDMRDKALELSRLTLDLLECDVSGADGQQQALDGFERGIRFNNAINQAITELRTGGHDDAADFYSDMWDAALASLNEAFREARDVAAAKAESESEAAVAIPDNARTMVRTAEQLTDQAMRGFAELFTGLDPDNPFTHSDGKMQATAQGDVDLLFGGTYGFTLDAGRADDLFGPGGTFACGGWTLCAGGPDDYPSGEVRAVAFALAAEPPATLDGMFDYQFGIVFDADGDPGNNYRAGSAFPNDTYDDTDRWYQVLGGQSYGAPTWQLSVDDAGGGQVRDASSNAVLIADGNSMTLVFEADEMPGPSGFRVTTFRHTGDYGMQGGEFSGDVWPPVGDPLNEAVFRTVP